MKAARAVALLAVGILVMWGCRSLPPGEIDRVTVSFWNPFPPEDGQTQTVFDLSADELRQFRRLCPDLERTEGFGCKSAQPPMMFTVHYRDGQSVLVQFCCDSLRTYDPDGNLDAPSGLRALLIKAIEVRAGTLEWED